MNRSSLLALLASGLFVSACASTPDDRFTGDEVRDDEAVLMTPINDIGLDDIEIPEYLAMMKDPYKGLPKDCSDLSAEVKRLNDILGSDLDVTEDEDIRRTQLRREAASSAIGSVLIPFRGVVRAVSGAAKNERDARTAYQRGLVRRAYLKGRGEEQGCAFVD